MSSIDYDLSKVRAVAFDVDGVLSPTVVPMALNGEPMRMVNVKDGYALQLAMKQGLKLAIITGARTEAVEIRFRGLGLKDVFMNSSMKAPILSEWMAREGLKPEEVAFVGDDIPDLQAMQMVGLPVAPADAAAEIKAVARYISPCAGGQGVARDLLEQIMKVQGLWLSDEKAFGW